MDELTTKRLAIIKQLYQLGINQSYDSEPINGFCLLSFHDSIEMFMKLCAESKGIKVARNTNFGDYFKLIPDLLGEVEMSNLNNRRVALKHYGSLPSKLDIEISRVNVSTFFQNNTLVFFNINFDDISLISLVKYDTVKEYLQSALENLNSGENESSIINSHIAFKELLFCYEEDKRYLWKSPFKICEDFSFSTSLHLKQIGLGRDFDNFVDKVQKSIVNLDDISKVLGFGLNFKKYAKFKIMTPYMNVWHEKDGRKYDIMKNDRINYNKKNAEFCFDFVIESSLKLQEFDFDINELYI